MLVYEKEQMFDKGGDELRATIQETMTLNEKLHILSDAAKYDVACTSSGVDRRGDGTGMGNCSKAGICR